MMGRLLEVKEFLIMAFSNVNCSDTIHSTDRSVLKDCVELLEPLHELTEEISGDIQGISQLGLCQFQVMDLRSFFQANKVLLRSRK